MQKIQRRAGAGLIGFCLLLGGCGIRQPAPSSSPASSGTTVTSMTSSSPTTTVVSEKAVVTALRLLDEEANPLSERDGCVLLPPLCRICAEFTGAATRADFWVKPEDEEAAAPPRCVGSVMLSAADTEAAFNWRVPDGFIGDIWVLLYDGDAVQNEEAPPVCRAMSDSCV